MAKHPQSHGVHGILRVYFEMQRYKLILYWQNFFLAGLLISCSLCSRNLVNLVNSFSVQVRVGSNLVDFYKVSLASLAMIFFFCWRRSHGNVFFDHELH